MPFVICIRKFKIHTASVWTIKWSKFGDFLVSSGGDGSVLLLGPSSEVFLQFSGKKEKIEKRNIQDWNCLSYLKTFYFRGTSRKLSMSLNFNELCMSTLLGKIFVCTILFSKKKKNVIIKEKMSLNGFLSEIKGCEFSKDGILITACARNKILWVWERKFDASFQCLSVFDNHESDIKETRWHPNFKFLFSSSYEGFFRIFQKKLSEPILRTKIFFTHFSIWSFDFDEHGNQILYCSGKGEFFISVFQNQWFKEKKKIKSGRRFSIFFFSFNRNPLLNVHFSLTNSFILLSGDEENVEVLKISKIWIKKKNLKTFIYGGLKNFWIDINKSIIRSHYGSIYKCIWNPKNEKIFATCGEDMIVRIWAFLFS
jgi:WD40 repeat protein